MPVTLAVLNDYPLVVAGLRSVLDSYPDRVRVAELDTGTSVATRVDVVLHDTYASTPGTVPAAGGTIGPGALKRVIYTWSGDSSLVRAAVSAGADGYLLKSTSADELVDAIERISRGEPVLPQGKARTNAPALGRWPGDEHGLSNRESEMLALICQGLSNNEISRQAYLGTIL